MFLMMMSSDNLSANMCFLWYIRLQPHVLPSFRRQSDTVFHWQYLSVSHVTISDCSYGHWDYTAGYNSPHSPKMLEGKDKDRHKPAVASKFLVEMFLLKSFKISNTQSRSRASIPISLDSKVKNLPESLLDNIPLNNSLVRFRLSWSNTQIHR